jgi:hypothetical protein
MRVKILRNEFKRLAAGMKPNADTIERQSAERIAKDWAAGVRVDTGNLRDSIHAEKRPDGWAATTTVPYAPHEEFGTRSMRGSHAARAAAVAERDRFVDGLRKGLLPR